MPRVMKKKKPLRGSVRQNRVPEKTASSWFGFGARLALLILGALGVIVFSAWLWHSGWVHRQIDRAENAALRLTQKAGFSISDVTVKGRYYTDKDALLSALNVSSGAPILTFDPQKAHDKIAALPWTESVSVLRSLPGKIMVRLKERQPMARWQRGNQTVVIDGNGKEIGIAKASDFPKLPLVVGEAAPEQTKALLEAMVRFPEIAALLKAAVRVGERRWNLHLEPHLVVRLPEREMETALVKLAQLIKENKIEDRGIVAVDLRLPDRMVLEPGGQTSPSQEGGE